MCDANHWFDGLWNDLSGASSKDVNYYVIEKNLANSPVTINAGSGTVAFEGSVGSNRASLFADRCR